MDRSASDDCANDSTENNSNVSQPELQLPFQYGKDLWDALPQITDQIKHKEQFNKYLRSFLVSYRKAFDSFSNNLGKAMTQFEKDFVKVKNDSIIDTLSTSMVNLKMCFDEVQKSIQQKSNMMSMDIIEPLELFQKHYQSTNVDLLKQANQFWSQLHQERTTMLFAKESYYNQMFTLQSLQQSYQETLDSALGSAGSAKRKTSEDAYIGIQDKKLQQQQIKAEMAEKEYLRAISKFNLTIDYFDLQYKPVLNRIQEGDDQHINFVKFNLEKVSKYLDQLGKDLRTRSDELNQTIGMISSDTDIKIFIDAHKSNNSFLSKEEFQPYDLEQDGQRTPTKKDSLIEAVKSMVSNNSSRSMSGEFDGTTLINDNYIQQTRHNSDPNGFEIVKKESIQTDIQQLNDHMTKLLNSELIELDDKGSLIQMMHNKSIRSHMSDILNEISQPKQLSNPECLKLIADIIKFILTLFVHEQSTDYRLLYTILESSQHLFCVINKRKSFLASYLAEHGIWQDIETWKECIQEIVTMKISDQIRRRQKKQQAVQVSQSNDKGGFFKKGLGKIKGILQSKENKATEELKLNQNLIFNELSRFVTYFINFSIPYEHANEILLQFCEYFQMEQSRMHLLLTELQSNQKNSAQMFTDKEQLIWSLQRRGNRLKAFGLTDSMQIAGMSIKFIDDDETLRNLMACCRDWNDLLRDEIFKQALLRSSQHRLKSKRQALWLKILKIDPATSEQEYQQYQQISKQRLPKFVSDSIEVDVNRSFNNLKQIGSENLNRILKAYAIVNPSLDYCQGMNFIAGFLYLTLGSEALSFQVMKEIINKFKMSQLFNTELPMLKLNFYQLDRLISILLNDLHNHFKDEAINSSYYSSPYFITLFTSVLQMQTNGDHYEILLRLWDYFIINGWKSIFKVSLIILKEYEEQLLNMPFEVMLTQVVNMPTKFFINQFASAEEEREGTKKFDKQMKTLKIPAMLLERLKKEFDQNYALSVRNQAEPKK